MLRFSSSKPPKIWKDQKNQISIIRKFDFFDLVKFLVVLRRKIWARSVRHQLKRDKATFNFTCKGLGATLTCLVEYQNVNNFLAHFRHPKPMCKSAMVLRTHMCYCCNMLLLCYPQCRWTTRDQPPFEKTNQVQRTCRYTQMQYYASAMKLKWTKRQFKLTHCNIS